MSEVHTSALETLVRERPNERLPFIVTLRAGADTEGIAALGMRIDQRIDDPPLLLGTMTPKEAVAVAKHVDVVRVEHDAGGVHALEDQG